jgi:hypothetical protein
MFQVQHPLTSIYLKFSFQLDPENVEILVLMAQYSDNEQEKEKLYHQAKSICHQLLENRLTSLATLSTIRGLLGYVICTQAYEYLKSVDQIGISNLTNLLNAEKIYSESLRLYETQQTCSCIEHFFAAIAYNNLAVLATLFGQTEMSEKYFEMLANVISFNNQGEKKETGEMGGIREMGGMRVVPSQYRKVFVWNSLLWRKSNSTF